MKTDINKREQQRFFGDMEYYDIFQFIYDYITYLRDAGVDPLEFKSVAINILNGNVDSEIAWLESLDLRDGDKGYDYILVLRKIEYLIKKEHIYY